MKKIKLILTGLFILFLSVGIMAQTRDGDNPPDPPGGHGSGDDEEPGGGAPIGSGITLLLSMAAAYGGKKAFEVRKKDKDQEKI